MTGRPRRPRGWRTCHPDSGLCGPADTEWEDSGQKQKGPVPQEAQRDSEHEEGLGPRQVLPPASAWHPELRGRQGDDRPARPSASVQGTRSTWARARLPEASSRLPDADRSLLKGSRDEEGDSM